jgi:hypothetical protein
MVGNLALGHNLLTVLYQLLKLQMADKMRMNRNGKQEWKYRHIERTWYL